LIVIVTSSHAPAFHTVAMAPCDLNKPAIDSSA
jgi:hypothetical protein